MSESELGKKSLGLGGARDVSERDTRHALVAASLNIEHSYPQIRYQV